MSLTLNWNAASGAANYKLYRSTTTFNKGNLPASPVTVASPAVSHEYTDVVSNTVYFFMISSVDSAGIETYGNVFTAGYFPDTGPGPTSLLRGDWEFGFFGEVPIANLFSASEISVLLGNTNATGAKNATEVGKYFKVVCNGRILFIPDTYRQSIVIANIPQLPVLSGMGFAPPITAGLTLSKNGYDFHYRLPAMSLVDANYLTAQTVDVTSLDFLKSEAAMISSLGGTTSVKPGLTAQNDVSLPGVYYHLGDTTVQANTAIGLGLTANANSMAVYSATGVITSITTGTIYIVPVLELLL